MHHMAGWWDGFELWVAGLPFLPQFIVVMLGAIPMSLLIAYLLDRGVRMVLALAGRDEPAASVAPIPPQAAASAPEPAVAAPGREKEPV
ncbi:MAG: hypothetical protein J2P18_04785 [Nocardia sp.]|nr:hypothetical protein [Nocardia sp.]